MPDFMTTVGEILAGGEDLIPHIEERAYRYATYAYQLTGKVLVFNDMVGWNTRKVSDYRRPAGAKQLDEGVDIPSNKLIRKRLAELSPEEWGDLYPITNRRSSTDLESVLTDTVQFLGDSMGMNRETKLFNALLTASAASGGYIGSASENYALSHAITLQTLFQAKRFNGNIFHVIHPYQELTIMKDMVDLSKTAVPDFRNQFVRQWNFGGFGGLNVSVSALTPRKLLSRINLDAAVTDGDKFKLSIAGETTEDITVSTTVATMVSNIKTALDALDIGTFTVSAPDSDIQNINVQSPIFISGDEFQLSLAHDEDGDALVTTMTEDEITIEEISGVARAPFWERSAVALDVRQAVNMYTEWHPRKRTLDIGATEVFGVGAWRADRAYYVESVCTSPTAVPNA
jgi:hypothetical protein